MAQSRRRRQVTANITAAKDRKQSKATLLQTVQSAIKEYPRAFLFRLHNARSTFFQRIRRDLSDSTVFFLGRNKVLQKALGKTAEEASVGGAEKLAGGIAGDTGVLFTRLSRGELEDVLTNYQFSDYSRTGSIVNEDVTINVTEDGILCRRDSGEPLSATLEPMLRAAGVPTMLRGGQVILASGAKEHAVCRAGDKLSNDQAKILKAFGVQTDEFAVALTGEFDCSSGQFRSF